MRWLLLGGLGVQVDALKPGLLGDRTAFAAAYCNRHVVPLPDGRKRWAATFSVIPRR
jgi:hypothetical protein